MTRVESRYEDVSVGPFDHILFETGVDGLQDVGTQSESADIESWIGDESKQMGRVLNGDRGGFVYTLAEFTSETMEKKKRMKRKKEKSNLEIKGELPV